MDYVYFIAKTDGSLEAVEKDSIDLTLKELQEAVNGHIEIVRPTEALGTYYSDIRIVCDECGLMKANPIVNLLASALYLAPDPIVGDCVICTDFNPDPNAEPDIYAFSADRGMQVMKFLHRVLSALE